MTTWNALLKSLDATFGFPTRISSTVKKLRQGFDNTKQEHVIWIEYRVKMQPGAMHKQKTERQSGNPMATSAMPFIRELMTVNDL